ncbi:MAG: hypothetical protein DYG89_53765 [Caldilinea sp. CFX5]|nr:hypothetical protein [Caldilinea sp. CFX5]
MLKQAIGHGGLFLRKAKRKTRPPSSVHHTHNGAGHTDPAGPVNPPAPQPQSGSFAYLFPELVADPRNTLPVGAVTIEALRALGAAMAEAQSSLPATAIPAGYTYFGQFVDHDITKQNVAPQDQHLFAITDDDFAPLTVEQIRTRLINERTAPFDLDSLYGKPARRRGAKMVLGPNEQALPNDAPHNALPPGKDPANNDVPRAPVGHRRFKPGQALIGDPRNDENLIISQMQVAFLKFHNRLVETQGLTFQQAAQAVRQHYQAVVIFDYLRRLLEPAVVDQVLASNYFFRPLPPTGLFMPLEFSVAAFRFGHSMVRPAYRYNMNFATAPLDDLFKFTAFSGQIGQPAADGSIPLTTVPRNWIIQWENFLPFPDANAPQPAMPLDTALALPLAELPGQEKIMARLAQRNLLRGYLLNLPTGQSVARTIGGDAAVLSRAAMLRAANPADWQVLQAYPFLLERTPLWYYILLEAKAHHNGQRLGLVGSTIVAETIIGLIRQSKNSILQDPTWQPTLGAGYPVNRKQLELHHLIEFAGVGPVVDG